MEALQKRGGQLFPPPPPGSYPGPFPPHRYVSIMSLYHSLVYVTSI